LPAAPLCVVELTFVLECRILAETRGVLHLLLRFVELVQGRGVGHLLIITCFSLSLTLSVACRWSRLQVSRRTRRAASRLSRRWVSRRSRRWVVLVGRLVGGLVGGWALALTVVMVHGAVVLVLYLLLQ
jgi:hypothetical protein